MRIINYSMGRVMTVKTWESVIGYKKGSVATVSMNGIEAVLSY